MPPRIDIVIPALNEADNLKRLLPQIRRQEEVTVNLIIADGGSRDSTSDIARAHGAKVIHSDAGRGLQMNAGAAAGRSRYLAFLHADSGLTTAWQLTDAVQTLEEAMREARNDRVAGHFQLRFSRAQAGHAGFYRYLEGKSALNRAETFNGDQGLLMRRSFFRALGGFSTKLPIMEDQIMGAAIREQGLMITLPHRLLTSARRYESEGHASRHILMMLMMCAKRADLSRFFDEASGLYRDQPDTSRIHLEPYIKLFARLAGDDRRVWNELAQYTIENGWQPLHALDLCVEADGSLLSLWERLEPRSTPLLRAALASLLRFGLNVGLQVNASIKARA